ncbi:hypothetical protein [Eubacterium sp.]
MSLSFGVRTSGPEVPRLNITEVQMTVTELIFVNSKCKQLEVCVMSANL